MRRTDREITEFAQMLEIMERCDCCRLGLQERDGVYIVPLNFGYQVDGVKVTLYFHGADAGKKLELIRANPSAGFEMDAAHELVESETACGYSYLYQSIVGKGRAAVVEDVGEKIAALQCIMSHYTHQGEWDFAPQAVNRLAVIRLEVAEWNCKAHR